MKRFLVLLLSLTIILTAFSVPAYAEDEISVFVDGNKVTFDALPFIENGRTLVPIRAIAEAMGAEVRWYDGSRTVEIQTAGWILSFEIGGSEMRGTPIPRPSSGGFHSFPLDVPAKIVNDRTFIPLRAVAEAFGCTVDWDSDTRAVMITSETTDKPTYVQSLMSQMPQDKNYIISPLSLKIAMLMAAAGAEGETKDEILSAFDTTEDANREIKELMSRLESSENGEVHLANSIWFNKDYYGIQTADFSDAYKEIIAEYFKGNAETVTDKNSIEAVNAWVDEQTKGKIKNLLAEDYRHYLMTLVNTVYMKAKWQIPFEPSGTRKDTFTDCNGNASQIDFMHQTEYLRYYEKDGVRAVRLPYQNGLSMYVVLGDTGNFEIADAAPQFERYKVRLAIPKFKTETSVLLSDKLQEMGVRLAFLSGNSDFDSMVTGIPEPIMIEEVLQKAIIEVDEEGTEAAAATAVIIKAGSALIEPEKIIDFQANEPFTYFITEDASNEVLFAGRYVKPQ